MGHLLTGHSISFGCGAFDTPFKDKHFPLHNFFDE